MPLCSVRCTMIVAGMVFFTLMNLPSLLMFFLDDELLNLIDEVTREVARGRGGGGRAAKEREAELKRLMAELLGDDNNNNGGGGVDENGDAVGIKGTMIPESASMKEAQRQFINGIQSLSLSEVLEAVRKGADPNKGEEGAGCPLYQLAMRRIPSEYTKATAIMQRLLQEPAVDPNGDGTSWSPLKTALSNKHMEMVELLLANPQTIREVEVSGMDCSILKLKLSPTLKFFVPKDRSVADCFVALPEDKKVDEATSILALRNRNKHTAAAASAAAGGYNGNANNGGDNSATSKKTFTGRVVNFGNGPSSNVKASTRIDPRNPFITLPADEYPPWDTMVINPTPFSNIVTATLFYFFGPPPPLWAGLMITVCFFSALAVAIVTLSKVAVAEKHRKVIASEAEAAKAREKEAAELAKQQKEGEAGENVAAADRGEGAKEEGAAPIVDAGVNAGVDGDADSKTAAQPSESATAVPLSASSEAAAAAQSAAVIPPPPLPSTGGEPFFAFADDEEIEAHEKAQSVKKGQQPPPADEGE